MRFESTGHTLEATRILVGYGYAFVIVAGRVTVKAGMVPVVFQPRYNAQAITNGHGQPSHIFFRVSAIGDQKSEGKATPGELINSPMP
jgi:hypothetical protein